MHLLRDEITIKRNVLSIVEIDEAVTYVTNVINNAIQRCTPKIPKNSRGFHVTHVIRELQRERNRRRWQR